MRKERLTLQNSAQVGGHTYTIYFDKELEDSDDYGIVNHRRQEIVLNPTRPESQKLEALIHEFLHIVNKVYISSRLTEEEITGLAEGLNQIVAQLDLKVDWSQIRERGK